MIETIIGSDGALTIITTGAGDVAICTWHGETDAVITFKNHAPGEIGRDLMHEAAHTLEDEAADVMLVLPNVQSAQILLNAANKAMAHLKSLQK